MTPAKPTFDTLSRIMIGTELGGGVVAPMAASPVGAVAETFGLGAKTLRGGYGTGSLEMRFQTMLAKTQSGQRALNKARARQQKAQFLQQRMSQSLARLASASPQIYNQIMAGRQLPQGAVVLGGQPRVDLMEQLALRMATSPNSLPGAPAQPSVTDLI